MKIIKLDCPPSILGEGPLWHIQESCFYWVDILGKKLHRYQPELKSYSFFIFEWMPSAVVPTNSPLLLIAFENGIATFDPKTNELIYLIKYHEKSPEMRMNDGKCDPFGNFWIGSMAKNCDPFAGNLYRFKQNFDLEIMLPNCTISNGMAWSSDSRKLYFIDSAVHNIRYFDFQNDSLQNEKILINRPELKYFDGMTIDTEGKLWTAHCGDSHIRRWDIALAEPLLEIKLPCPKVTSLTFGGAKLNTIFITTAQEHMTTQELAQFPESGSVFIIETNFQGLKAHSFII